MGSNNDFDYVINEMLIEEWNDIYTQCVKAHYATNKHEAFDKLFSSDGWMQYQLGKLEIMLKDEASNFTSGPESKPQAGDLTIACALDMVLRLESKAFEPFPKLAAFFKRISTLPAFDGLKELEDYCTRS
jgi:hypothetical protein